MKLGAVYHRLMQSDEPLDHDAAASMGAAVYDVEASDPQSELVDRSGISPSDVAQVSAQMRARGGLRGAEDRHEEA
jgi:hypothetical protein